jgi:hypothetical protein
MATEGNGAATAAADDTTAAPADQTTEQTDAADPKVEAEAREMGWIPQDKFKGDPALWRPADEYVKRGRELMPLVQAENRRLKKEMDALRSETKETIANLGRMSKVALDRQRDQLVAQYDAQKEKAVELGDKRAYETAKKAEATALKDFDKAAAEAGGEKDKPKTADQPGGSKLPARDQAAMDEWLEDNAWFTTSRVLRVAADDAYDEVKKEMPAASMAEVLAEVRSRVEAEYPQKFGKKPTASSAPKVEGGGNRGGGGNGRTWDKLPADVKAIADDMIKGDGLFLEKGEKAATHLGAARERYAKEYLKENA